MSADLTIQLEHAKGLLQVRESALRALREFPNQTSRATPGSFLYQNLDVSCKNGRLLLLQNYVVKGSALTFCSLQELGRILGFGNGPKVENRVSGSVVPSLSAKATAGQVS